MGHVEYSAIGNAPTDFAFAYTTDYRNVPRWMFGVSRFEPVTELDHGLGAIFDTAIDLGPTKLPLRVEVTSWSENEHFTLTSIKGIAATCTWRFAHDSEESTEVTGIVDYKVGGGLPGKALDKLIGTVAGPAVRHIDRHLRAEISSAYQASTAAD